MNVRDKRRLKGDAVTQGDALSFLVITREVRVSGLSIFAHEYLYGKCVTVRHCVTFWLATDAVLLLFYIHHIQTDRESASPMAQGGRRVGAGRKPGGKPRPPEMRALANAVVRDVLAGDRNPVLRLVEIGYDDSVPVEVQVSACAAAAPYLFPRKSMELTASVALEGPNAQAAIEKLLRQFAPLPSANALTIEATAEQTEIAA